MGLTIVLGIGIGVLGLIGLARGIYAGLLAIAGTLLAAVLIDLWHQPLALWIRETFRPERPALPVFGLTAAGFLLTALLIGYGGSVLLPQTLTAPRSSSVVDRLLGAALGALNGALLGSYLLRYAAMTWTDQTVSALIAGSSLAALLARWLPWFVLTLVGVTAMLILVRNAMTLRRARTIQPTPPRTKALTEKAPIAPAIIPPAPANTPARPSVESPSNEPRP